MFRAFDSLTRTTYTANISSPNYPYCCYAERIIDHLVSFFQLSTTSHPDIIIANSSLRYLFRPPVLKHSWCHHSCADRVPSHG